LAERKTLLYVLEADVNASTILIDRPGWSTNSQANDRSKADIDPYESVKIIAVLQKLQAGS
jgi:hypothetical protein